MKRNNPTWMNSSLLPIYIFKHLKENDHEIIFTNYVHYSQCPCTLLYTWLIKHVCLDWIFVLNWWESSGHRASDFQRCRPWALPLQEAEPPRLVWPQNSLKRTRLTSKLVLMALGCQVYIFQSPTYINTESNFPFDPRAGHTRLCLVLIQGEKTWKVNHEQQIAVQPTVHGLGSKADKISLIYIYGTFKLQLSCSPFITKKKKSEG